MRLRLHMAKPTHYLDKFKPPSDATMANPEKLGKLLISCIEYVELMGVEATMVGDREGRTCLDTIIKKAYARINNGKSTSVLLKPGMYNGKNPSVYESIEHPLQSYDQMRLNLKELNPLRLITDMVLPDDDALYRDNGRLVSFTEAMTILFIKNKDANPEFAYCNTPLSVGITGTASKSPVKSGDRYSCLSDLIDISHNDKDFRDDVIHNVLDVNMEDGITYRNGDIVPLETLDEVIDIVNGGSKCRIHQFPKSWGTGMHPVMVPCIEKILHDSVCMLGTTRFLDSTDAYGIYHSAPVLQKLDEYDLGIMTSKGIPAIQMMINGTFTPNSGFRQVFHKMNTATSNPTIYRNKLEMVLHRNYMFKDMIDVSGELNPFIPNPQGSYREMSPIDYMFTTGIGLVEYSSNYDSFHRTLLHEPECLYEDGNYYACAEKLIRNISKYQSDYYGGEERPSHAYGTFVYHAKSNMAVTALIRAALQYGVCSHASGLGNPDYTTCMDFAMVDYANSGSSTIFGRVVEDMISQSNPLIVDLKCSDDGGKRPVNCMDKLVGNLKSTHVVPLFVDRGVLLDRVDCTDGYGNAITCIDKIYQSYELSIYLKNRAIQINGAIRGLESLIDAAYASGEDDTDRLNTLVSIRSEIVQMRQRMQKFLSETGYDKTSHAFESLIPYYDLGSEKVHLPSVSVVKTPSGISLDDIVDDDIRMETRIREFADDMEQYLFRSKETQSYARELSKHLKSAGMSREYTAIPRMFKMFDTAMASTPDATRAYEDTGIDTLISTSNLGSITFNMFECKDGLSGKTISCLQKLIGVSEDYYKSVYAPTYGRDDPKGSNVLSGIFANRDMFKPTMCDSVIDPSKKTTCLEYLLSTSPKGLLGMNSYVSLLSNRDFSKYADIEATDETGRVTTLRKLVCKHAPLFDLGHYLTVVRGGKGMHTVRHNVGATPRPRMDHVALALHAGVCGGCDQIKDKLDRRICYDKDCFDGYLSKTDLPCKYTNEMGECYGGFSTKNSKWATDYADDMDDAMSHFRYQGSDDIFGLSGIYEITPTKQSTTLTRKESGDYGELVRNVIYPAIERSVGLKYRKYKGYTNATIDGVELVPPQEESESDYYVRVMMSGTSDNGKEMGFVETIAISDLFVKGGLFGNQESRHRIVKLASVESAITKISTTRAMKSDPNGGMSAIKMIISNRPADFIRSSTCQPWTSCMGFRSFHGTPGSNRALLTKMNLGGYIIYVANEELSPHWHARMSITPAMEKPNDPDDLNERNPTMMFRVDQPYGLPQYMPLMEKALAIILRDNGYNAPGSYSEADHMGLYPEAYIFNTGGYDPDERPTRRGGRSDTGGVGGTRYREMVKELWKTSAQRCLDRVVSGDTPFAVSLHGVVFEVSEGNDCRDIALFGRGEISPTEEDIRQLYRNKLIPKDMERNFDHLKYFYKYDGGTVKPEFDSISDSTVNKYREDVDVVRIGSLTVKKEGRS